MRVCTRHGGRARLSRLNGSAVASPSGYLTPRWPPHARTHSGRARSRRSGHPASRLSASPREGRGAGRPAKYNRRFYARVAVKYHAIEHHPRREPGREHAADPCHVVSRSCIHNRQVVDNRAGSRVLNQRRQRRTRQHGHRMRAAARSALIATDCNRSLPGRPVEFPTHEDRHRNARQVTARDWRAFVIRAWEACVLPLNYSRSLESPGPHGPGPRRRYFTLELR